MKLSSALFLTFAFCFPAVTDGRADNFRDAFGPRFGAAQSIYLNPAPKKGRDSVHRWNQIAINASGLDHTPVAPGESRVFGEQLGPGRSSRAMAIVHIAIFDAMNALLGGYRSYTGVLAQGPTSMDAAVSQAAYDTLVALFPSQAASFDSLLTDDLAQIKNKNEQANGIDLGRRTAAAILAMRVNDGSQIPEPHVGIDYFTSNLPGHWRQDPISLIPLALGAHRGECNTFVLESSQQFRVPPPPAMTSAEYTTAYNEVKAIGGDGIVTSTQRTVEQTFVGTFWAYDGTPSLCAPPRLYNQITVRIADQMGSDVVELARLLALVNVAMADAGIAIWEAKYRYRFWRPVTGVREADEGSGPTGQGDGNAATMGDPTFTPLGAPASNLDGPN